MSTVSDNDIPTLVTCVLQFRKSFSHFNKLPVMKISGYINTCRLRSNTEFIFPKFFTILQAGKLPIGSSYLIQWSQTLKSVHISLVPTSWMTAYLKYRCYDRWNLLVMLKIQPTSSRVTSWGTIFTPTIPSWSALLRSLTCRPPSIAYTGVLLLVPLATGALPDVYN